MKSTYNSFSHKIPNGRANTPTGERTNVFPITLCRSFGANCSFKLAAFFSTLKFNSCECHFLRDAGCLPCKIPQGGGLRRIVFSIVLINQSVTRSGERMQKLYSYIFIDYFAVQATNAGWTFFDDSVKLKGKKTTVAELTGKLTVE